MARIALGIEYDGSGFAGWQSQPHARNVQDQVEAALSRVAAEPVRVVCAGRTDTGVHATAQVVHFDTSARRTERQWILGGNSGLPPDVALTWARPVPDDFHARFSARRRSYRYLILNRRYRPALWRTSLTACHRPLDEAAMAAAAACLRGEHDFTSFRALACQARHPVRRIEHIAVRREGDLLIVDITANAFLHHMVRNIVGTLMQVGRGERDPAWVAELLRRRDRAQAAATAPAAGLYLVGVGYPPHFGLPEAPVMPLFSGMPPAASR